MSAGSAIEGELGRVTGQSWRGIGIDFDIVMDRSLAGLSRSPAWISLLAGIEGDARHLFSRAFRSCIQAGL